MVEAEGLSDEIRVDYRPAPDIPEVPMDVEKLKQVVINIVRNGIESMSEADGSATQQGCRGQPGRLAGQNKRPGPPAWLACLTSQTCGAVMFDASTSALVRHLEASNKCRVLKLDPDSGVCACRCLSSTSWRGDGVPVV